MKDRLRTVHQEDQLQDVLLSVAALRKRCAGLKPSNFNSQELRAAVRGVLKMGWCGVRHGGRVAELCRTSVMWLAVVWVWCECGVSVVTGPWDSIEPPSEETSTQGNCVNFVWWECLGRMYQWTVFYFTSFVLLSYVMLYFTENFDEWNWPKQKRSLSCSSLQVEILSGKNYFFFQTLITS